MIRKKALRLALVLFTVLLLGLAAVPVGAVVPPPPPPPERHCFMGAVTFAGNPAPQGTIVSAHWDGSSKQTTVDADGNYGKTYPGFYIEENGINPGDTITFKVNGVEAATHAFDAPDTTTLNLSLAGVVTSIVGVTYEVNCEPLGNVIVKLFEVGGDTPIASTTSDGDGNYVLPVPAPGNYDVVASKTEFSDATQANVEVVAGANTLDFRGDHGLIPETVDMDYFLYCMNLYLEDWGECNIGMDKFLAVMNAYLGTV